MRPSLKHPEINSPSPITNNKKVEFKDLTNDFDNKKQNNKKEFSAKNVLCKFSKTSVIPQKKLSHISILCKMNNKIVNIKQTTMKMQKSETKSCDHVNIKPNIKRDKNKSKSITFKGTYKEDNLYCFFDSKQKSSNSNPYDIINNINISQANFSFINNNIINNNYGYSENVLTIIKLNNNHPKNKLTSRLNYKKIVKKLSNKNSKFNNFNFNNKENYFSDEEYTKKKSSKLSLNKGESDSNFSSSSQSIIFYNKSGEASNDSLNILTKEEFEKIKKMSSKNNKSNNPEYNTFSSAYSKELLKNAYDTAIINFREAYNTMSVDYFLNQKKTLKIENKEKIENKILSKTNDENDSECDDDKLSSFKKSEKANYNYDIEEKDEDQIQDESSSLDEDEIYENYVVSNLRVIRSISPIFNNDIYTEKLQQIKNKILDLIKISPSFIINENNIEEGKNIDPNTLDYQIFSGDKDILVIDLDETLIHSVIEDAKMKETTGNFTTKNLISIGNETAIPFSDTVSIDKELLNKIVNITTDLSNTTNLTTLNKEINIKNINIINNADKIKDITQCELVINNLKIGINLRPGLYELLEYAKTKFNLILMTAGEEEYCNKVIEKLNLRKYFFLILPRQYCIKIEDIYIKDLSFYKSIYKAFSCSNIENRDILIIDNNIFSFCANLSRGILVASFVNDKYDIELFDMISYLQQLIDTKEEQNVQLSYTNENHFCFESLTFALDEH